MRNFVKILIGVFLLAGLEMLVTADSNDDRKFRYSHQGATHFVVDGSLATRIG